MSSQKWWVILNANFKQWGNETYPTKEAAEKELKEFWKGYHGVDLKKFTIQPVGGEGGKTK